MGSGSAILGATNSAGRLILEDFHSDSAGAADPALDVGRAQTPEKGGDDDDTKSCLLVHCVYDSMDSQSLSSVSSGILEPHLAIRAGHFMPQLGEPIGRLFAVKVLCVGDPDGMGTGASEKEQEQSKRLLDVLDRLAGSRVSASRPASPVSPSLAMEECVKGGRVFVQEILDVFCEDEKVYIAHSNYDRTLADPAIRSWFRIPNLPTTPASVFHLDPDGTFQQHTERIRQDVLYSLKFLAAEMTLGLLFLHDHDIIHLSIRLASVMVSPAGHVQIGDFFGSGVSETNVSVVPTVIPKAGFVDLSDVGVGAEGGAEGVCISALHLDVRLEESEKIVDNEKADWWDLGRVLCVLGYGDEELNVEELREREDEEDFRDFVHQLLSRGPQGRLAGPDVRKNSFLRFEQETWTDILNLRYPPCSTAMQDLPLLASVDLTPSGSTSSLPLEHTPTSQIHVIDQDSSPVPHSPTQTYDAPPEGGYDQHSRVQPFPSTTSLYYDADLQRHREVGKDLSRIKFSDSGLELDELVFLLIDQTEQEDTDDDGAIEIRRPQRRHDSGCVCALTARGCRQEDWAIMTVDEMVALSLLQARNGTGPQKVEKEDIQRRGLRAKRRPNGAQRIARASKRAIGVVSRYIYATVRCR
ncbi:hypothetical protein P691DRAFT_61262 [Macrolepiota fuliginosa MF-IS2]|uniref:Protein kinase domain-containing protein n=1 Tax=Macrolepiota fuliginosa MF-IS2 TaxID=1400762 RepID=A0A9P6C684_9AGAR|nr:hypothetical protein P691DRAFT_61262 [Macrolepiota fuliginosa MF-IS2]